MTFVLVKLKLQYPPSRGRRGFDYQSRPVGGEFELHPRIHVESLAWQAIMGGEVLEDFRGKD